jgi:predicted AAA+ superfamily ATPase
MKYKRPQEELLKLRLSEPVHFINLLAGPRQVGKTTIIRDLIAENLARGYYISVDDEPGNFGDALLYDNISSAVSPQQKKDASWLLFHWQIARERTAQWLRSLQDGANLDETAFIFAIDEIQKIEQWSDVVKGLWDADRAKGIPMHVVLLGSAPLLMQKGLSESLAGRYEIMPITHWGFTEMQQAFGFTLEQYVYFGGYPGSAWLIKDEARWRRYVRESLIQPNIEKDIVQMVRIKNPLLLKQLFELGCHYSGQELSLTKMIANILEAKHTETLADYINLLTEAKMLTGLRKFSAQEVRKRNSAPKLNVFNMALMSAMQDYSFAEAKADRSYWGRLVESCIGAHLLNTCDEDTKLYYWREGNQEVDFILAKGRKLTAIEVKSGPNPVLAKGLDVFTQKYVHARKILVGAGGVSLAEFLSEPAAYWLNEQSYE